MTKHNSRKPGRQKHRVPYGTAPVDLESDVWAFIAADPYRPYLTVRTPKARGRRTRIFTLKGGRIVHLLSDIEYAAFLKHEAREDVVAIWEQVPLLPHWRVIDIARRLRITRYPMPTRPASTDLLLAIKVPGSYRLRYEAVSVKPAKDLENPRVRLKLACESEFWAGQAAWRLETDVSLDTPQARNRRESSSLRWSDGLMPDDDSLRRQIIAAVRRSLEDPSMDRLLDAMRSVDSDLALDQGTAMSGLRFAVQHGFVPWPEDLRIVPSTRLALLRHE